jgi:hypothetical protein
VLESPARGLLNRHLCEIRYQGGRTGEPFSLTVSYVLTPSGVLVVAGNGSAKTWWRNFRSPRPASLLLDGQWVEATGAVVAEAGEREAALTVYRAANRHAQVSGDDPVLLFTPHTQPVMIKEPRRRVQAQWVGATVAGELLGFCAPALVAALVADAGPAVTVLSLVAAGIVEGAVLGAAQAAVLRVAIPAISPARWIGATSLGAAVAWLVGMMPSTLHDQLSEWPPAGLALLGAVAATILLGSIGAAQWLVLRRHRPHCANWIWVTAAGWCLGLAAFMLVAMPLWHEGQSRAAIGAIGVLAAVVMAAVMGAVTSFALPIDRDRTAEAV